MERRDGIVRWSQAQNPKVRDQFITFDLNYRSVQLHEATGHAVPTRFDYSKLSGHIDLPPMNAFDWSSTVPGLLAVGTPKGDVQLLRIDDNSNGATVLPVRVPRACQALSFSTQGLLAVGLDRVRNDHSLQIFNIETLLSAWNPKKPGWNLASPVSPDSTKLEQGVSITSTRFFEDQPQTLVVGIKNTCVRIHDLRVDRPGTGSSVLTFNTKCNNNLAIDHADPNYFASSALDQPGLMIWDRRAADRGAASQLYTQALEPDDMPWGAAVKLKRIIESSKNLEHIRSLRFNREHRGTLGVLSSAGQLQVLKINKEHVEPGSSDDVRGSPECLEVKRSYDLEYPYFDQDRKVRFEDRIVSFDWLTLGASDLPPRLVALRANGKFEIKQMPAKSAGLLTQMIPWATPRRPDIPYHTLMKFADPKEQLANLGPLFSTAIQAELPVFGPHRYSAAETQAAVEAEVLQASKLDQDPVVYLLDPKDTTDLGVEDELSDQIIHLRCAATAREETANMPPISDSVILSPTKLTSSREQHDKSHYAVLALLPWAKEQADLLANVKLARARVGYLFDCKLNKSIVADDPWLQDAWEWIQGAELAAKDDGMVSSTLDLAYMGVYTVWMNELGNKPESRKIESSIDPDERQWERFITSINKRAGRTKFSGAQTAKPQHRLLCLAITGYARTNDELDDALKVLEDGGKYAKAAAWALFEGHPDVALEILNSGGKDLYFVAMALEMKLQSTAAVDTEKRKSALQNNPYIADDPYLRAISHYISGENWAAIADEKTLPMRDRVAVALKYLKDDELTTWLTKEMNEAIRTGDIEGLVLAGITDKMVDIFAEYIAKFNDVQTPILILSFCYPRYITDHRCEVWRKVYKAFLQRHKEYIKRVRFEQQSSRLSRDREFIPTLQPPPPQVTIRCVRCDSNSANDLDNAGSGSKTMGPAGTAYDNRNPLKAAGVNAGLCCPRCGGHLPRCAVCQEHVGVPRSDRPELSLDPQIRRLANFPSFCLRCKHTMHADHAVAWYAKHVECPVAECKCQCNLRANPDLG